MNGRLIKNIKKVEGKPILGQLKKKKKCCNVRIRS